MPQMFPLSWLILFYFIIVMFYCLNTKLFFIHSPNPMKVSTSQQKIYLNFKWLW